MSHLKIESTIVLGDTVPRAMHQHVAKRYTDVGTGHAADTYVSAFTEDMTDELTLSIGIVPNEHKYSQEDLVRVYVEGYDEISSLHSYIGTLLAQYERNLESKKNG
jgi:hypothetical protein